MTVKQAVVHSTNTTREYPLFILSRIAHKGTKRIHHITPNIFVLYESILVSHVDNTMTLY